MESRSTRRTRPVRTPDTRTEADLLRARLVTALEEIERLVNQVGVYEAAIDATINGLRKLREPQEPES